MRKIILFCLLIVIGISQPLLAQDNDSDDDGEIKTLLDRKSKIGIFGAVDLKVGKWNEKTNLLVGGHAGVRLDNKFTLAVAGYGITTRTEFQGLSSNENVYLSGGYGGLYLGYAIFYREVLHINFPILIGGGGIDIIEDQDGIFSNGFGDITESSGFFVLEPGIEVEINITRFFKLAVGGTYRLIEGANFNDLKNDELNGFSTQISFKIGKF